MVKQCGANESLKGLQEKTKEMADTLTDAVDLEKLEEFKAKAEGIADEVKGKLVSQIPKPKNLQVELGKLAEVKDAIGEHHHLALPAQSLAHVLCFNERDRLTHQLPLCAESLSAKTRDKLGSIFCIARARWLMRFFTSGGSWAIVFLCCGR